MINRKCSATVKNTAVKITIFLEKCFEILGITVLSPCKICHLRYSSPPLSPHCVSTSPHPTTTSVRVGIEIGGVLFVVNICLFSNRLSFPTKLVYCGAVWLFYTSLSLTGNFYLTFNYTKYFL